VLVFDPDALVRAAIILIISYGKPTMAEYGKSALAGRRS
jgi:hypothetical protein